MKLYLGLFGMIVAAAVVLAVLWLLWVFVALVATS